ncbi:MULTISPECIES: hypothetical protein [Rhodobacterales]|uniref:hypothetical protein n=1 Tax=Rhodobacterales TaxID=204455 RepID=UPI0015F0E372|nr:MULTISPECIES: hypothetical protein [Rhodobacterales]MDO6589312.1 hypothetical protein [Yoonia sp. 1_MG-2023]
MNRIDVFSLSEQSELTLVRHIEGFSMPHGLDIRDDRLVVTNYKDQTLRLLSI